MVKTNPSRRCWRTILTAIWLLSLGESVPPAHALEIKQVKDPGGNAIILELGSKFETGDGLKSIGRFIHQLGIKTVIPPKARCISPCPLAFFAGSDSNGATAAIKHTTGSLGFTGFLPSAQDKDYTAKDLDNEVARTQRGILQVLDYLAEIKADEDILRRIYEDIPDRQVKYISDDELLAIGVSIFDDAANQLIDASALRKRKQRS